MNDANAPIAKSGRQKRMKIGFFGHFGTPNLGNEATLVAILSRLRIVFPDREFCCICSFPDAATARYGIEAVPISSRSVRIWDRQARLDKRLRVAFVGLSEAMGEYVRAFRALKGMDALIIPGTGLLTDAFGLSVWRPYGLFQWSLLAKLRGCRLLFVSVGAGPMHSAPGRILIKSALSIADYRSYRDASSKRCLKDIGFRTKRDRIYPDLVFSLPQELLPADEDGVRHRSVVGLGLMEYAGKYSVADPSDDTYVGYLESLVILVRWLLEQGYDVKLLLGDEDVSVIERFRALLRERLGSYDEGRVTQPLVESFPELLSHLNATDIVVATRFHNVLFGVLLNKPVIAISFHHKCTSLMSDMGLSEYCHDIHDMNADKLIDQFQQLVRNAEDVKRMVGQRVSQSRAALDEQYDLLFEGLEGASN